MGPKGKEHLLIPAGGQAGGVGPSGCSHLPNHEGRQGANKSGRTDRILRAGTKPTQPEGNDEKVSYEIL